MYLNPGMLKRVARLLLEFPISAWPKLKTNPSSRFSFPFRSQFGVTSALFRTSMSSFTFNGKERAYIMYLLGQQSEVDVARCINDMSSVPLHRWDTCSDRPSWVRLQVFPTQILCFTRPLVSLIS